MVFFGMKRALVVVALVAFVVAEGFVALRTPAPRVQQRAHSLDEERAKLELLVRRTQTTPTKGVPVNVAEWTYVPGVREVLRVHEPALTYLFKDALGADRTYVHLLRGQSTGAEMRVLDVKESRDELYALVHCVGRVAVPSEFVESLRARVEIEPLFDDEERASSRHAGADSKLWARRWARLDDPIDDWEPSWLLNGGVRRNFFPKGEPSSSSSSSSTAEDGALAELESRLWTELDALSALIRQSRTSGRYDLPASVEALRAATTPVSRRALRLSFAVASVLELDYDRSADRQALLDCTSTARRLTEAITRVTDHRLALTAALLKENH